MNEQIQTIIDRARVLLAAATQGPLAVGVGEVETEDAGRHRAVLIYTDAYCVAACGSPADPHSHADAEALAFAVNNIGTLCDALERSNFALEWWAADRAIGVESAREAWAVMRSMARAAGMVGTFLEQAAPLMRPDASGNVKAPNHVTATFTDGVQSYEVTIRREGGKTPADIIGEITARAEGAEHARDIFLDALGRIGAMCMGVLGEEWEGAPHDEMVGGLIDRAVDAEAQAAVMRAALTDAEDTIRDQAARFGAGFPCSVIDACEAATATDAGRALLDRLTAAEARVADMESVRKEQAAKLRRHLDELRAAALHIEDLESKNARMEDAEAERDALRDRAGIAEGREACAKANVAEIAGRLDAQNAGLVQMARDRDAALAEVEALKVERDVARQDARRAENERDALRDEAGPRLTVAELQRESYETARAKGWHDEDETPPAPIRVIAWMGLVCSEAAEAIEDARKGRMVTTIRDDGKPEGLGSELADIVIRVCDSAGALGIDMEAELRAKMAFNRTRSHKHGGKLA